MNNQNNEEMSMAKASGKEVATQRDMVPMLAQGKDIHTILANAETQIEAQNKIIRMALRVTNENDWIDQNGTPYLEYDGSRKIARLFGVSVRNVTFQKIDMTDDKGAYYMCQYSGEADWNGTVTPEIGTCSSRDKFFAQRKGEVLPQSEVQVGDIMKKAHTNLMNRAIKSKLGLSFTWEEIAAGTDNRITREKCTGVAYKTGTRGGNTSGGSSAPRTAAQQDQRNECWNWILEYTEGNVDKAQDVLAAMTAFQGKNGEHVPGKRDIQKVSDAQMRFLYPRVKKEIEAYRAAMGPTAPPPADDDGQGDLLGDERGMR